VEYWKRSKRYPMVLVCAATFLELSDPPAVFEQDLIHAFGRVPGLRNPPEVTLAQVQTLVAPFGIRVP
jgi:hypothetical protein